MTEPHEPGPGPPEQLNVETRPVLPGWATGIPLFCAGLAVLGWTAFLEAFHLDSLPEETLEALTEKTFVPAAKGVVFGVFFGIILVLAGGALLQTAYVKRLGRLRYPWAKEAADDMNRWPRLFVGIHVLLYGLFIGAMFAGILNPDLSRMLQESVAQAFSEGHLEHVTEAYRSGSIPQAAWATFANNFLRVTVIISGLPSIIVPFFGVCTHALSFSLAGFVMAPIHMGMAQAQTFHCITITLELEAYVLASFGIAMLPLRVIVPEEGTTILRRYAKGVRRLACHMLIAGVILAFAAIYEAATLIWFSVPAA